MSIWGICKMQYIANHLSSLLSLDSLNQSGVYSRHTEELQSAKMEVFSLQSALSMSSEEIRVFTQQLKEVEATMAEEIENRDSQIRHLESHLDEKSQTIACLVKQLHQMKVELAQISETSPSMASTTACAAIRPTANGYQQLEKKEPEPPPDLPGAGKIIHRIRRCATSPAVTCNPDSSVAEKECNITTRQYLPTPIPTPLPTTSFRPPSTSKYSPPAPTLSSVPLVSPRPPSILRRSLPTPTLTSPPPISPRPPSTSPPQRLIRRASGVIQKRTRPAASSHHAGLDRASSTTALYPLDPVQRHKQAPPIPDFLQQDSSFKIDARPPPPVLPPIATNLPTTGTHPPPVATNEGRVTGTAFSELGIPCPPSHYQVCHGRQRHIFLARSQGLNSAPSGVRVLAGRLERGRREEEGEWKGRQGKQGGGEIEAVEGTLLVVEEPRHHKSQAWQELHQKGSK